MFNLDNFFYNISFKARQKVRAFLLFLILVIFQINFFSIPAQAFLSSKDACAKQPSCAAALGKELEIAKNAIKPFARAGVKAVEVSAKNVTTGAISKTSISTIGGVTIAAAGGTVAYLSADGVEKLQDNAFQNYCNNGFCTSFELDYSSVYGKLVSYSIDSNNSLKIISLSDSGSSYTIVRNINPAFILSRVFQAITVDPDADPRLIKITVVSKGRFDNLSEQQRTDIINDASISDLLEAVEITNLKLPDTLPGQLIEVDTDFLIDETTIKENPDRKAPPVPPTDPTPDPNPDPGTDPTPDPNPDPGTDPTPNPDPDPGTDPTPNPDPDSGTDPTPNPDPDPGTDPTPNPDPDPDPDPDPEDEDEKIGDSVCADIGDGKTSCDIEIDKKDDENLELPIPTILPSFEIICDECEQKDNFSRVPFYTHALQQLIDNPKFPFDIFGDFNNLSAQDKCPKVEMFQYTKELCFINDGLATFKYPIWIAWIIRLVLSL